MGTSALIKLKDEKTEQSFYANYDGYPENIMPKLIKFMSWLHDNKIRKDITQSSAWIIVLGLDEDIKIEPSNGDWKASEFEIIPESEFKTYKGNTDWSYELDIINNIIKIKSYGRFDAAFTYAELLKHKNDWTHLGAFK